MSDILVRTGDRDTEKDLEDENINMDLEEKANNWRPRRSDHWTMITHNK